MRDILIGFVRTLRGLAQSIDTAHAIRHGVHPTSPYRHLGTSRSVDVDRIVIPSSVARRGSAPSPFGTELSPPPFS